MNTSEMDQKFQATVTTPALYTQHLAKLFDGHSNWTNVNLPGEPVIPFEAFRRDTEERIARTLAAHPKLRNQDFSERRKFPKYLSYRLTRDIGAVSHYYGEGLDEPIIKLRAELALLINDKVMLSHEEDHPLANDPMKKFVRCSEDGVTVSKRCSAAKPDDIECAKVLLGRQPKLESDVRSTLDILEPGLPNLLHPDDSNITRYLVQTRTELRAFLKGVPYFLTPDDRAKMMDIINSHLVPNLEEQNEFIEVILQEAEERSGCNDLIDVLWTDKQAPHDFLQAIFGKLLSNEHLNEDEKIYVEDRIIILDQLLLDAYNNGRPDVIKAIGQVYNQLTQKLNLTFGEMSYLSVGIVAQAPDITIQNIIPYLR